MLLDSQPTPFDLKFRLFGFPVRVHPLFWIIMALLGGNWVFQGYGPVYILLWVACGFVSILVHELGHAFLIRYYGSPSAIVLTGFGGYAEMPYPPPHRGKRIAIALAGPAAGFLLLGLVVGSELAVGWASGGHKVLRATFNFLFVMNLFWNLFNLLPIWPLDGGRVCRELCSLAGSRRPDALAMTISLVVSGLLAIYGLLVILGRDTELFDRIPVLNWFRPNTLMTIWFAMFAVQSFMTLQELNRQSAGWRDDDDDDSPPWRR